MIKEYIGKVVNVKDTKNLGRVTVRIPQIHGEVGNSQFISDDDLPWAIVNRKPNANSNVAGQYENYKKGEEVRIVFLDQEYDDIPGQQPYVIGLAPKPDPKQTSSTVNTTQVNPSIVIPIFDSATGQRLQGSYTVSNPSPCQQTQIPPGVSPPDKTANIADGKCGQQAKIKGSFFENVADFLAAVSNGGRIGTKLVSTYSGEVFAVSSYVKKYASSILGIFRDGLKWIKAIITKYIRAAIDELTKLIIVPIKGVLNPVQQILEDALNQVGCTIGDVEKTLQNLIEDLLNSLINAGINVVFGCLDTLVDGILNEIISQVSALIDLVIGGISSIAGIVGGLGDIAGEALKAVLDFLGISCGGAGDCTADGQKTFVVKLITNDGYGIPSEVKNFLQGGIDAIDGISEGILTGAGGVEELRRESERLATGERLGNGNFGTFSTFSGKPVENRALKNAFRVAESLIPTGNISNFCNTLSLNQPTNAVIIGQRNTENDSSYSVFSNGDVNSGETASFTVRRNNERAAGVISVLAYKASTDNIRISNSSNRGDVNVDAPFTSTDLVSDSRLPTVNSVFFYRKIIFDKNEVEKTFSIPTNNIGFIDSKTEEVTFTVGVFRSADDINLNSTYPGDNLPSSSSNLNTAKGKILFQLPDPFVPPSIESVIGPSITISGTTTISGRECVPSLLITSQPPDKIVAIDGNPISIGTVARATTAGYTINYQWQKSKSAISGWQNITDGSYSVTVSSNTQVLKVIASGITTTGSSYTFTGYVDVPTTITTTYDYSGSTTPVLTLNPASFYANDNEYYRCIVSASGLTTINSSNSLLRVNKSDAYSPPDTTTSQNVIDNPNGTEPSLDPPTPSEVLCEPFVPPVIPEEVAPSPTVSGVTVTNPGNIGDISTITPIEGIPAPEQGNIIAPVIVGPDGGVNSVILPDNIPAFAFPPIVSIIGPGAGATAQAELDEFGNLKKVTVKSRGFGYTPNNSRNLCAILDSVDIVSPGLYYESSPTVFVNGDSSIAVAEIDETTGRIVSVRITNPQDKVYDKIPRIEFFGGGGIGATARATIKYVDCGTIGDEYQNVLNRYKSSARGVVSVVDCP